MKTLREKIVNAGKSGNPEFLVLKKEKLFALRKELRKEKAALKKMENANYQCLISRIRNKYSTKKLQEQQKIIETLEIKKHKSPRKLQVFNITNKTKSKTIETKRWDFQDLDLLLMVENVIEQVVYSQPGGNLQEDLTNDLWSFWLSKKLKIISSFNQEKNHTAKFETYLYRCLKNRLLYEINHKYNNHGMIFDSETVNVAEALQTFQQYYIDHQYDYAIDVDEETRLDEKLAFIRSRLNVEQLRILELKANGLKYQTIGDKLGVSRRTIIRRVKKIQEKLFNKDRANFIQFSKMKVFNNQEIAI